MIVTHMEMCAVDMGCFGGQRLPKYLVYSENIIAQNNVWNKNLPGLIDEFMYTQKIFIVHIKGIVGF